MIKMMIRPRIHKRQPLARLRGRRRQKRSRISPPACVPRPGAAVGDVPRLDRQRHSQVPG
jgi:hypothetical protein